ncbi:hypothetical protein [Lacisediminihabitans changchengi]|uniref:DUF559 domain-containing protein n=1 Tax=Lacisediminihabitans changchengi TaxID=2787634 RepID=A0A934SJT2_9MICO|nr:hypothetical protein [Lacisediminihabitans changchengi]MBK4346616.1 hypothetical protein [Lacisediminihabitans changchengi]
MRDIAAIVDSLGGMAQKQQLVARGARDLDLTAAVKRGDVIRARQGWYTTLPTTDLRVRAVRVGGRLTGISAILAAGGWVLGDHQLHVSVHDNAARLRSVRDRHVRFDVTAPHGVVLHWDSRDIRDRGDATSVGLMDALHRVVLDEDLETAVAAIDWALRTGRIEQFDLELLVLGLPADFEGLSRWADDRCDSLPESLSRTRLRSGGHRLRSQVPLTTGERIDLVVDDTVALEINGEEFHAPRFEQDHHKGAVTTIEGFHSLRASARMVFTDWQLVEAQIDAALAMRSPQGNSGVASPARVNIPGSRRRRRRERRRSPEFPMGVGGNTRRGGALALT